MASFPPTTIEVTAPGTDGPPGAPEAFRLTCALLAPTADPGVLVLTQTPADAATARALTRLLDA